MRCNYIHHFRSPHFSLSRKYFFVRYIFSRVFPSCLCVHFLFLLLHTLKTHLLRRPYSDLSSRLPACDQTFKFKIEKEIGLGTRRLSGSIRGRGVFFIIIFVCVQRKKITKMIFRIHEAEFLSVHLTLNRDHDSRSRKRQLSGCFCVRIWFNSQRESVCTGHSHD